MDSNYRQVQLTLHKHNSNGVSTSRITSILTKDLPIEPFFVFQVYTGVLMIVVIFVIYVRRCLGYGYNKPKSRPRQRPTQQQQQQSETTKKNK
jgi:hypothetical protein